MKIIDFECDILSALENEDFLILTKLKAVCHELRTAIASNKKEVSQFNIECNQKKAIESKKLTDILQKIQHLEIEIDQTQLQCKIVEKKIAIAMNHEETLKNQVVVAKNHREILTLELVDVQQKSQERKLNMQQQWRAIKKAGAYYKRFLNFRIDIIEGEDHEKIKVSFFTQNKELKNQYYAHISNKDNLWKVESIHPQLKDYNNFHGIIDISKQLEISDVTMFLCKLRKVFIESYL